jgi:putative ABC transport system ATP-binding protein
MIELTDTKKYFKSGDNVVKAVDGISLSLREGELGVVVGKSGSGKSTLLSLLGALDKPDSGSVEIDGQNLSKLSDRSLTRFRSRKVGFVFQSFNLVPNLSALDNVSLAMEFAGVSSSDRKARASELLEMVGLDKTKHSRRPGRLSGGEQQRVAIARALANRPKLILADEPTGNLDSKTSDIIVGILADLAKEEKTAVIVVTHDESLLRKANRTFRLDDGRLIEKA